MTVKSKSIINLLSCKDRKQGARSWCRFFRFWFFGCGRVPFKKNIERYVLMASRLFAENRKDLSASVFLGSLKFANESFRPHLTPQLQGAHSDYERKMYEQSMHREKDSSLRDVRGRDRNTRVVTSPRASILSPTQSETREDDFEVRPHHTLLTS